MPVIWENVKKPKTIRLFSWILFFLLLTVAGISSCTTAERDLGFEKKIQSFVNENKSGTEIKLINGKNLGGWSVHGIGSWVVDNGVISVRRGIGYLATRCTDISDFELTLDVRIGAKGNSGVFFRSRHPKWLGRPWPVGYEAQIDNHDAENPTGSLYKLKSTTSFIAEDNKWFSMKILAVGSVIKLSINDIVTASSNNATQTAGFIALQAHDPWSVVEFRNIRLRIP